MKSTFLSAEWRNLIMANYSVNPEVLRPYLPKHTELDIWNGNCYVSLVGFMFLNTRVKGMTIPFHKNFEEINLRFYVKHFDKTEGWKRGVVFIKEIVPKAAITFVARTLYNEPYETLKMNHGFKTENDFIECEYQCFKNNWQSFKVRAINEPTPFKTGSEEEFISEHYWGYTRLINGDTQEYGVEHPPWKMYPVTDFENSLNFNKMYGAGFDFLNAQQPVSVFLSEGSAIIVKGGRILKH